MKTTIMAVIILGIAAFFSLGSKKAECFGCITNTCYGAGGCGQKCVCVKQGTDMVGTCYKVE